MPLHLNLDRETWMCVKSVLCAVTPAAVDVTRWHPINVVFASINCTLWWSVARWYDTIIINRTLNSHEIVTSDDSTCVSSYNTPSYWLYISLYVYFILSDVIGHGEIYILSWKISEFIPTPVSNIHTTQCAQCEELWRWSSISCVNVFPLRFQRVRSHLFQ